MKKENKAVALGRGILVKVLVYIIVFFAIEWAIIQVLNEFGILKYLI